MPDNFSYIFLYRDAHMKKRGTKKQKTTIKKTTGEQNMLNIDVNVSVH